MNGRQALLMATCAALVLSACDGERGSDAGGALDGGRVTDGGSSADAGVAHDAAAADGAAPSDAGGSPDSSCEAYARHICAPAECPERIFAHTFGGEARCVAQLTQACVAATLEGANVTAGDLDRCAGSIACFQEETDPFCLSLRGQVGDRVEGAPCVSTNQCAMHEGRFMVCVTSTPNPSYAAGICEPGRCTATLRAGQACVPSEGLCEPGSRCEGAGVDARCAAVTEGLSAGSACGPLARCGLGLRCGMDDRCAAYVPEGGACDRMDFGACALGRGLFCEGGVCVDRGRLIGEACGPGDNCPVLASECRAGVCVDTAEPAGGPCISLIECELGLGCDMGVCRNVSCDG